MLIMKLQNKTLEFQSKGLYDFIDITEEVKKFAQESGARNGIINIQLLNTSAGLIMNENEPLLMEDFKKNLEKLAPHTDTYAHDDLTKRTVNVCENECINGHSHCKAIHLLVNITLNIVDKAVQLGQWQRVFLVELDRPRKRIIQFQIVGD